MIFRRAWLPPGWPERLLLGETTMKQQTLLRATAAALLGFAVLVGGKSYASDTDDVKATIDEFHAALTALDISKMDAVWGHDASVMDKEPVAKTVTLGWEGTRKNFEGLFAVTAELKVTQADGPHIQVQGDTAWSMGVAWVGQKLKTGQVFGLAVFEADVLRKQNGRWLLVSHATSVLPPPQ
jgi:ketosteroid isomerase-like protein